MLIVFVIENILCFQILFLSMEIKMIFALIQKSNDRGDYRILSRILIKIMVGNTGDIYKFRKYPHGCLLELYFWDDSGINGNSMAGSMINNKYISGFPTSFHTILELSWQAFSLT